MILFTNGKNMGERERERDREKERERERVREIFCFTFYQSNPLYDDGKVLKINLLHWEKEETEASN